MAYRDSFQWRNPTTPLYACPAVVVILTEAAARLRGTARLTLGDDPLADLVTSAAPNKRLGNVKGTLAGGFLHATTTTTAAADGLCSPCPPVARRDLHYTQRQA
jgi:hypothetical protein